MVKFLDVSDDSVKLLGIKVWGKPPPPKISVDDLPGYSASAGQTQFAPWQNSIQDGEKFPGGFGATQLYLTDYWTLRARSDQLFKDNMYARGIIRRLVTNEINTGLSPEATPDESILGVAEDSLAEWSEDVENRFNIWDKNPQLCDWKQKITFGAIQRAARMEALISGDVLVVLRQSRRTRLPLVQLIRGDQVRTPFGNDFSIAAGHKVIHGVELDKNGRVVAHWIKQEDLTSKRIPAFGSRTGRRVSWLIYGTDKRLDDVRGTPLLSLVLQSLKEIDRYRDSAQRKAVINSILAMFIKKTGDKMGTLPMQGGAVKRATSTTTETDGTARTFNLQAHVPGMIIDELQTGEEPVMKGGEGTDINFGAFEEAIIQAVAWSIEIPPEILRLSFSNNYSASQAAINEFKIAINRTWGEFGEDFCTPIQIEWLLSEVLIGKISASGLLESWRDPSQYDIFGAWTSQEWYGSIKPSTDMLKQAKGSALLVEHGWSTNAREARVTTGSKFTKNVARLKRENTLLVEAMRPLATFKAEFGTEDTQTPVDVDDIVQAMREASSDA